MFSVILNYYTHDLHGRVRFALKKDGNQMINSMSPNNVYVSFYVVSDYQKYRGRTQCGGASM